RSSVRLSRVPRLSSTMETLMRMLWMLMILCEKEGRDATPTNVRGPKQRSMRLRERRLCELPPGLKKSGEVPARAVIAFNEAAGFGSVRCPHVGSIPIEAFAGA